MIYQKQMRTKTRLSLRRNLLLIVAGTLLPWVLFAVVKTIVINAGGFRRYYMLWVLVAIFGTCGVSSVILCDLLRIRTNRLRRRISTMAFVYWFSWILIVINAFYLLMAGRSLLILLGL